MKKTYYKPTVKIKEYNISNCVNNVSGNVNKLKQYGLQEGVMYHGQVLNK